MNKGLVSSESNRLITPEPRFFGLPRPVAGAFIGVFSFLLYAALSRNTAIAAILLSPGYLGARVILSTTNLLDLPKVIYELAIYSISSIPPAVIGSLIVSKRKAKRVNGIILLAIYVATWIFAGLFMLAIYVD